MPADAVSQVKQARAALDRGSYEQCCRLVDPVVRDHPDHPGTAEALYLRALAELRLGKRRQARTDCEKAARLARDEPLRSWIHVQLGNLAYDDELFPQAKLYYAEAVDHLPNEPPADQALYRYGDTLLKLGRFDEARDVFARILERFPDSALADEARRKQSWSGDFFTIQCGAFDRVDLAHKSAARLRQHGFNALAFPDPRKQGSRHVVRIGRFNQYREARQVLARVKQFQPDAFILP